MQDYWWVTRPKRKLNPIPEELAAFCSTALGKKWTRNRDSHIEFEIELEQTGTKRVGERRDASGSGGRTHAAMLYSLGLWFEKNETVFLTLAGEAIMQGKSLVPVLKKQVLRFQYPSAYSASVKVAPRFKIRPFYFLDYREALDPTTRWSDRLQSSSGEWSGNVCDFYFRVYNKIIKDIKVPFKMVGGERVDDTPVHKALREALANCLINADYHGLRGVVIRKEPDKLVLANPGYIRTGKKQMRLGGESDPRNKALMKMFNLINIGERAGSGVPNIFNVWADEGWEEPVIEERFDPDRTVLSLSFKKSGDKKAAIKNGDKKAAIKNGDKKVTKKTQLQYDKILGFMEDGKEYGIWDFCELLGLKESRTKDILKGLSDYIEVIGGNRDRRYKKK